MNTQKSDWNDIHVAYQVALHGTLTAAAEVLGVHHSTVLRRINTLEKKLGTKLFHRHARGYVPTEAGHLLTQAAENTQNNFDLLLGRLQGSDTQLTGTLVVTSVSSMSAFLIPLFAGFKALYPQIKLEYAADSRVLKLEHGEAHVSIRPGQKPSDPDYVVQALANVATTFYASRAYVAKHGGMKNLQAIKGHSFISTIEPFTIVTSMRWMNEHIPSEQISIRLSDFSGFIPAAKAGLGVAPLSCWSASKEPDLLALIKPPEEWIYPLWLVTHGDMHRSTKVQAFTQFLKQHFQSQQALLLGDA